MQAVILAAGKGTRMRPLTYTVPKPMIPLMGKPKLQYTLDMMPQEIEEIVFVINHLGDQIKDFFGSRYNGRKITYVVQEALNGTGGALQYCKDILRDDFLVMMGDDLYHPDDIRKIMQYPLALLALQVDDPSQYGILVTNGNGHLNAIKERPHQNESDLVNTGLYKLNKKIFEYPLVPISDTEYGLPQTLVEMGKDHPIVIERATRWTPLGRVEDISVAEEALKHYL